MAVDTVVRGRKPYVKEHFSEFMLKNKKLLKGMNVHEAFDAYIAWAESGNTKAISQASFSKLFKGDQIISADETAEVVTRTKGSRMSLIEQFDSLEQYVRIMTDGVINSLLVYGVPGVGKTETIKRALKKYNASFEYFQGGVKDAYSIAKILYENRNDKIIVFDDFDSIFKIKAAVDILKVALQDHYSRTITWADGTKRAKRDTLPTKFEFTSSVIFVSNRPRIDAALRDRSMLVCIDAGKAEILEWIRLHFNTFLADMPSEIKETVYTFLKANLGRFKHISYRVFKKAVCDYLVCQGLEKEENYWKKVVLQNSNF